MLEKLKKKMANVDGIQAKEFRLVINTCHDIYGENNPDHFCQPKAVTEAALKSIYVDVINLSQYFHQGKSYFDFGTHV